MEQGPYKVVLADDDPATLCMVSTWLRSAGYEVLEATNGLQALNLVLQTAPHFLITDWDMPHLNGLELCRAVRTQHWPHYVYCMFMSDRSDVQDISRAFDAGADDYLIKPLKQAELMARLMSGERLLSREEYLRRRAATDPLTGVLNRRSFYDECHRELIRASREGHPLSCVLLDVDFFKQVNDKHGHLVGDLVLRAIATLLCQNSRRGDLVCRYGGEEFCLLMPGLDEHAAHEWADRMRLTIAENVIDVEGGQIRLTSSFGVSERLEDTYSPEQLLLSADEALRVAKQSGRNRVVRFGALSGAPELDKAPPGTIWTALQVTPARAVMTTPIIAVREDESARQGAEFLVRFRINSVPVVNAEGDLVGILSERDLLMKLSRDDSWQLPIRDFMHTNVVAYDEDTPVMRIHEFLARVSIRRVVIVRQQKPVGIISRGTLLRWLGNWGIAGVLTSRKETDGLEPQGTAAPGVGNRHVAIEKSLEIAQVALELQQAIRRDDGNFAVHVVREATRIEELVTDVLSSCQDYCLYEPQDAVAKQIRCRE